jgi:hypothetical protein
MWEHQPENLAVMRLLYFSVLFYLTKGNTPSFVSTVTDDMLFSHWKHACLGRYLIDFELKMIIANVLMNYDMKFAGARSQSVVRDNPYT